MYFSGPILSQVPRTWNLKYFKTGLFLSLLSLIFGFLTPKSLTHTKFQDEKMTRTIVITENKNSKRRILPWNTHFGQIFKPQQLWNCKELRTEIFRDWSFQHDLKIVKNEQNLRGKGVIPWMIWHGITLVPIFKKGDQQDYNNNMPISVLLNISKLKWKLVNMIDFRNFESKQMSL